jgi:hypothetical protein
MRWAGHVERMGEIELHKDFFLELRECDHLEDPGVDGRKILKRISKRFGLGCASSV